MPAALAAAVVAVAVTAGANAAGIDDRRGRWSCMPTTPLAPQIEIDFTDAEYRRCDQNICSSYDLTAPEVRFGKRDRNVVIVFAPRSQFVAAGDGSHFVETIVRGANEYVSSGSCDYRAEEPPAVPVPHRR